MVNFETLPQVSVYQAIKLFDSKNVFCFCFQKSWESCSPVLLYTVVFPFNFSVYKSLGCAHGCGDGLRGRHGDNLRQKGHNCLQRLQRINAPLFRSYMQESIKTRPIQEMVDFFHAFLGFCVDPVLILQASHSEYHKFLRFVFC